MKKYFRNRTEFTTNSPSPAAVDPPTNNTEEEEPPKKPVVQPPLPRYPPPPDSPPSLNVVIKQEREDDDTQNDSFEGDSVGTSNEELQLTEEKALEQNAEKVIKNNEDKPKKTICKEFMRGECKRPMCKYAHEMDISQLEGLFTFCWNYQNGVCKYPNCRFVHASVFEVGEFYRTGILPPHARSHIKNNVVQPPPNDKNSLGINFGNPHPPAITGVDDAQPVLACESATTYPFQDENLLILPHTNSPLKREWSEIIEFSSTPRDLEADENSAKKCKNCDMRDFSLKYYKELTEKLTHDQEEMGNKMKLLSKKSARIFGILDTLFNTSANKSPTSNGHIMGDNEKSVLDQLGAFISSNRMPLAPTDDNIMILLDQIAVNNRIPPITTDDNMKSLLDQLTGSNRMPLTTNDDNIKNNMSLKLLVDIAKYFNTMGDLTLPNETSREA